MLNDLLKVWERFSLILIKLILSFFSMSDNYILKLNEEGRLILERLNKTLSGKCEKQKKQKKSK